MNLASAAWCNFNNTLVIKCFNENFEAQNVVPKIRPYFFIKQNDLNQCKDTLKASQKITNIESGDYYTFDTKQQCVKVECLWPYDIKDLRQELSNIGVQTYEADISFVRRWMIDEDIYPYKTASVLFWDMEVDARKGLAFADNPSARILSFAGVDNRGREFFICDDDEEETVAQFLKLIQNYPVLVGYNNINWDLPYIIARSKIIGFNYPFRYHQHMDMMLLYDKSDYGSYSSLKLDDVAQREFNTGKAFSIDSIGGVEALWRLFLDNKSKLREYNLCDAKLVKMLEDKLKLLQIHFNISAYAGVLLSDTNYVSRIIDTIIFRRLIKEPKIFVLRNRQFHGDKTTFFGAYVHQPERALHRWVFEFDFKSLYPSIMMTWNIGLDTKDDDGDILSEKARFTSGKEAVVVKILKDLQRLRDAAKVERDKYQMGSPEWNEYHALQIAYKLISNSSWGALGESAGRMFDVDLAESITLTGQAILKETMRVIEQLGARPLYADTDSIFCTVPKHLAECDGETLKEKAKHLERICNSILADRLIKKYNIPKDRYCIVLEFQNLFCKMFFTGKKKQYIGLVYAREKTTTLRDASTSDYGVNTNISLIGLSMKKYNTCRFLKLAQKKILNSILDSNSLEEAQDKIKNICLNVKNLLYSHAIDNSLIQRTGVRKDLNDYKVNSIQAALGRQLQTLGLFRRGDVLDYVIVDVKDGKLVPKVLVDKNEKVYPTLQGLRYYEDLLCNMVERLLGERLNLQDFELDKWL